MLNVMLNVFAALSKYRWAIDESYFSKMHGILRDKSEGNSMTKEEVQMMKLDNKQVNEGYMAMVSSSGDIMAAKDSNIIGSDGTGNGVQIIKVVGSMFKRADMFSEISGAKSMEQIGNEIKQANANPNIGSIVLEIDSPGGTVDGTETLGNIIKDSNKPIIAFVSDSAMSAAYWIASQADEIIASGKTAFVGSIGVLMTHVSYEGWYAASGMEVTYVTATDSNQKVIAPDNKSLSEDDIKAMREIMDQDRKAFVSVVKNGRKGKLNGEDLFTGKIFASTEALKNGLIDRTGSLDDAIRRAARLGRKRNSNNQANQNINSKKVAMKFKNIELGTKDVSIESIGESNAEDMVLVAKSELEAVDEKMGQLKEAAEGFDKEAIDKQVAEAKEAGKAEADNELAKGVEEAGKINETLKAEKETAEGEIATLKTAKEKAEGELATANTDMEAAKAEVNEWKGKAEKLAEITGEAGKKIIEAEQDTEVEQEATRKENLTEAEKVGAVVMNARDILKNMGIKSGIVESGSTEDQKEKVA